MLLTFALNIIGRMLSVNKTKISNLSKINYFMVLHAIVWIFLRQTAKISK